MKSLTGLVCSMSLAAIAPLGGCSRAVIPNTDIPDTEAHRAVIEFCEVYRHAVERRDVARLLELAHQDYYEDGGSVDASDDLDYAGLQQYLQDRFVKATSIRYEIRYRDITPNEKDGFNVSYSYSASYRLPDDDEPLWRRALAENQLELVPYGESFKIISGM